MKTEVEIAGRILISRVNGDTIEIIDITNGNEISLGKYRDIITPDIRGEWTDRFFRDFDFLEMLEQLFKLSRYGEKPRNPEFEWKEVSADRFKKVLKNAIAYAAQSSDFDEKYLSEIAAEFEYWN